MLHLLSLISVQFIFDRYSPLFLRFPCFNFIEKIPRLSGIVFGQNLNYYDKRGKEKRGKERKGKDRSGKERREEERRGEERRGEKRRGKERRGEERMILIFSNFLLISKLNFSSSIFAFFVSCFFHTVSSFILLFLLVSFL